MDELQTLAEIETRFPSEWVLLADPQKDERGRVCAGRLLWHSKDRDEVRCKLLELRPKRSALLYVGKASMIGAGFLRLVGWFVRPARSDGTRDRPHRT